MSSIIENGLSAAESIDEESRVALKRVKELSYGLLSKERFLSVVFMRLKRVITYKIPTAGVMVENGSYVLYLNPKFINSLNPVELGGVIKHEIYHLIFEHPVRRDAIPELNYEVFNIAADFAINCFIKNELPATALHPKNDDYRHLNLPLYETTEFYYKRLLEEQEKGKQISNATSSFVSSVGGEGEETEGKSEDQAEQKAGVHDWKPNIQEDGEDDNVSAQEEFKDIMREAVEECSDKKHWGSLPREIITKVEDIAGEKTLPWDVILKRFVKSIRKKKYPTRNRPNRRFGVIRPGYRKEKSKYVGVVIVDTSASINDKQYSRFVNELPAIDKIVDELYWIHCDVKPYDLGKFDINNISRRGRGGTNYALSIKYAEEKYKPGVIIYLTDGECNWNFEPAKADTIWIITNRNIKAPITHGHSTYMKI